MSIPSSLSKILEIIVHHQIFEYFDFYNLLSTSHFGFRKNLGTKNTAHARSDAVRSRKVNSS